MIHVYNENPSPNFLFVQLHTLNVNINVHMFTTILKVIYNTTP